MDVSVLLSVGSFAVSERVLKPKASVLVILGCVLAYDLTTKTHDVSALRVYRGPALIAFTIMMTAWSLRTWRRNGVACDELLFLPGTPHAANYGLDGSPTSPTAPDNGGDAAAGPQRTSMSPVHGVSTNSATEAIEMTGVQDEQRVRLTSVGSDHWDDEEQPGELQAATLVQRTPLSRQSSGNDLDADLDGDHQQTTLERFQENHPRIIRIGTLFFFRTPDTTTDNATYAPSGPSVFGAGLDMTMPILINFHLFIEQYNHIEVDPSAEFTAKILPLIFLSILIVRTGVPPGRRRRFWSTMRFTFMAPFHKIRFRDTLIGDILTTLVKPFQDILFALSYYGTVVYGTVVGSYGLAEAGQILEQSWVLHNVVLPCCAMLPLWWRFLQSLRAAYDNNKRWPYYGDSLKYLSASVIVLYGMTHPEGRRSTWWIISFILALLYQIWWDTVMEWELFVIAPRAESTAGCDNYCCARISSFSPESRTLFTLHMYITQPISEFLRRCIAAIPNLEQIQLRPKRLYKTDSFYWRCFILNASLRFLWMLCFIPAYRLTSASTGETQKVATFSSDVNNYLGVLMPVAEIVRRAHWGFLKVEMETIRMMNEAEGHDHLYSHVDSEDQEEIDGNSKHARSTLVNFPSWLDAPQQQQHSSTKSRCSNMRQCCDIVRSKLFLAELTLWVVAFVGLGYWATY